MMHISKNQIKLIRSLGQRKQREEHHLFVAEGAKCIEELMLKFECLWVIVDETADCHISCATMLEASPIEIEQMSMLRTSQGVIGVFRLPDMPSVPKIDTLKKELILVLDDVQDPGNVGTIIRTADWFGIRHIICSSGTADCFNPKVIQATMGSLARVELTYTNIVDYLEQIKQAFSACPIYGTMLNGSDIYQTSLANHGLIIMGNEGKGISLPVQQYITIPLTIPPFDSNFHPESLNVAIATAVSLALWRR